MVNPTSTCWLLGNPVSHSLSPTIHNVAFSHLGLPVRYEAIALSGIEVGKAITAIDGSTVIGANVTIPHKEAVLSYLDELTPVASKVGAVNTIFVLNGKRMGHNTDVEGFLAPLQTPNFQQGNVVVLGAGGAARAVLVAVSTFLMPTQLTLVSRDVQKAAGVCQDLGCGIPDSYDNLEGLLNSASLIVNTTPLGMTPDTDRSPVPESFTFGPHQTVYDLIYAPSETKLMQHARRDGAKVIGGLPMLIGQAAASFEIWTGKKMPIQIVENALKVRLGMI